MSRSAFRAAPEEGRWPRRQGEAMAARARSILVGYDGSEAARRALAAAADLSGYGSSLVEEQRPDAAHSSSSPSESA